MAAIKGFLNRLPEGRLLDEPVSMKFLRLTTNRSTR
jgi:hypothetical protein